MYNSGIFVCEPWKVNTVLLGVKCLRDPTKMLVNVKDGLTTDALAWHSYNCTDEMSHPLPL